MRRRECLAIGASMGGPKVLRKILPVICKANTCPIFITQHIVIKSTECFRNSLSACIEDYTVKIGESLDVIEPKTIYLYPGFGHMRLMKRNGQVMINIFENGSMKNSIDALFSSVSDVYGEDSTAIVLTGMGIDGMHGAEDVKLVGGEVIVQDKDSSLVWSMPSAVACKGLADCILPIDSIAKHVSGRKL